MTHPLDRPVRRALTSGWQAFAEGEGDDAALRLKPEYGPFAASVDTSHEGLRALSGLRNSADGLWVVETTPVEAPPGLVVDGRAELCQMTADAITPGPDPIGVTELTEADYPDMLELALMTKPGPFAARTGALGRFIGIHAEGRLVAMAGERMRLDRFTEVSGVCTHPDHRGRGHAAGLMRQVARRMLTRGETPFLHSYAWNHAAIGLYESLGFRRRSTIFATILRAVAE